MVEIVRIPALSDNYVWLVHEACLSETVVIDPCRRGAGAGGGGGARVAHHPDLEHALAPRSHRRQRPDQGVGRKRRRDLRHHRTGRRGARIPSLDRT
jgi:hypothetical protein